MNILDTMGRIQIASPASEWVHLALGRTSDQTLNSGVVVPVQWEQVIESRGLVVSDWWSASTNPSRVTVPAGWGGLYYASANLNHSASSAGTNRAINLIVNNGATPVISDFSHIRTDAGTTRGVASATLWLNSGDYIEAGAYQNSGSTLSIASLITNFRISRLPLGVPMGTSSPELVYVEVDKDGDGDKDPLTSTSWDGDAKNGTGTINWNTDFGVPVDAKRVVAQVTIYDTTNGQFLGFQAKSTTTNYSCWLYSTANTYQDSVMDIPVAADGTTFWAATSNVDQCHIRVLGWFVERPRQT